LTDLFNKWTERSAATDFAGLRDLLVREQLLNAMPVEARRFVNQQTPLDAAATARSADAFLQAHAPSEAGVAAAAAVPSRPSGHRMPPQSASTGHCQYCGGRRHTRNMCPANNQRCNLCHRRGHFRNVCRAHQTAAHLEASEISTSQTASYPLVDREVSSLFLGQVDSGQASAPIVDVLVNDYPIVFRVDTGADVSVISEADYISMTSPPPLTTPTARLVSASSDPLPVVGMFTAQLTHVGHAQSISQPIFVVSKLKTPLLSFNASRELGIIKFLASVAPGNGPSPLPASGIPSIEAEFESVFTGLGNMDEPCAIKLRPDARPHAVYTARNVPLPLRSAVKTELKKNGSARICVDLRRLNDSVQRELHQMPTVDEVLGQVSGAKLFTKLDANSGFWQVPLAADSQILTTFITPYGRYCFQKLPFGITSAPEIFQKRMSQLLDGLDGVVCLIDDILVFGATQEEHDRRLRAVLSRLQTANVTLNRSKSVFAATSVDFLGVRLSPSGIEPDDDKVKALLAIPAPTGIPSLRRFLGMANQLGKFSSKLADLSKPLRELLSSRNAWQWDTPQDMAFRAIKSELSNPVVLKLYHPHHDTKLCSDASGAGLGAVLYQREPSASDWRPVAYASRSLSTTEQRYATIEKEALGVTWACDRFSAYLYGLPGFIIETDHKPLVPLLSTKNLYDLPPRILRFRLRLARYSYSMCHAPGKTIPAADALSRAPLPGSEPVDPSLEESAEAFVQAAVLSLSPAFPLAELARAQADDPVCRQIMHFVTSGDWPDSIDRLPTSLRPYWDVRGELTVADNVLLRGHRLVIPAGQHGRLLQLLHDGHQGIVRCRQRAQESVWWPGLSSALGRLIRSCHTCQQATTPPCEPMMSTPPQDRPWQTIGVDLCELSGTTYLVLVDYFSRYPELIQLGSQSSRRVIEHMHSVFARWGIPDTVRSDNGPQFGCAEFARFSKEMGFQHITSSPTYAQSNGAVERCVQTMKRLLAKSSSVADIYQALLAYRSTPLPFCGFSPAQLMMGRRLRTTLPQLPSLLVPRWPDLADVRSREEAERERMKQTYDRRHRTRRSDELEPGRPVWVLRDGTRQPGKVVRRAGEPRSYHVEVGSRVLRRNRRHLIPVPREE